MFTDLAYLLEKFVTSWKIKKDKKIKIKIKIIKKCYCVLLKDLHLKTRQVAPVSHKGKFYPKKVIQI